MSVVILSGEKTIEKSRGSQGKQPGEPLVWAVRDLGTKAETGSRVPRGPDGGETGALEGKTSHGEAVSDDLGSERAPQTQAE